MSKVTQFRNGSKSQAEEITLLKAAGWKEKFDRRDPWRCWQEPSTKALYSMTDAISLIKSYQRHQNLVAKRK